MSQKLILPSSITFAMLISFILFAFMASLIEQPRGHSDPGIELQPQLLFAPQQQQPEKTKARPKPKPLAKSPPPPPSQTIEVTDPQPSASPQTFDIGLQGIDIGAGGDYSQGNDIDNPLNPTDGKSDSAAAPIVQIRPVYPIIAARNNIEGWVKLSFSIDTLGNVNNIRIVDSSPAHTFDRAAKKALKRWRYQPQRIDGRAVVQHNLQVQLDFSLE